MLIKQTHEIHNAIPGIFTYEIMPLFLFVKSVFSSAQSEREIASKPLLRPVKASGDGVEIINHSAAAVSPAVYTGYIYVIIDVDHG